MELLVETDLDDASRCGGAPKKKYQMRRGSIWGDQTVVYPIR